VDFSSSLQSLIPGTTGRVLAALVRTSMPLSGRAIAQLAGVSPAQAARVLPKLADLGLVEARPAPPAVLYALAPDHVATEPLLALSRLDSVLVEQLAATIDGLEPAPACVAVFGSFARHEARSDSDIDLLVVRPAGLDEDDDAWWETVEKIRARARRLSGNRIEILETGHEEARKLLHSRRPLWRSIHREALVVHGPPLDAL
jgi:DNA-binding transcriptional ArsR family regulator